jgi:hypothetical protein
VGVVVSRAVLTFAIALWEASEQLAGALRQQTTCEGAGRSRGDASFALAEQASA